MTYSKKSAKARSEIPSDAPLAAEGGIVIAPDEREPFQALDELMAVVEALCPRWPDREERADAGCFLL